MIRILSLFVCFGLLSIPSLFSQDLHVYYDAHADSAYYVLDGKRVAQPAVRKGNNVILHVNNYNNYLYQIKLKSNQQSGASIAPAYSSDFDPSGAAGGSPMELLFGGGNPIGGLPNLMGLSTGSGMGATAAEQQRQASIAAIERQLSTFSSAASRAQARAENLSSLETQAKTAIEGQKVQVFAAAQIKQLRLNPQLSPAQLKQLTQEYMSRVFGETDPKQLDLSKVLKRAEAKGEFSKLKQDYQSEVSRYASDVALLKGSKELMEVLAKDVPEEGNNFARLLQNAEGVVAKAETNLHTYEKNVDTFAEAEKSVQGMSAEELSELRVDYLVTMENDFSKTFRQPASGEQMDLQLTFTPVDSANISGLSTRNVSPIEVKVYGGLQVNASLGLSFGQFFQAPQSYFVRDSLIRSSDKDAFTPFLTSFVHFYPQGRRETSLGGSFGIGIPLGGSGSSLEAITFFLGPSLILGRNQRIVLSGGLIGGRTEQLANGYAVGDRFDLSPDLLRTEAVYRLGYSLGLSFNLTGGN